MGSEGKKLGARAKRREEETQTTQEKEDVGKEWKGGRGGGAGTATVGRFTSIYGIKINLCHQRPCPQKSKEACPTKKKEASLR